MFFEKPSLRTHVTFERGMTQLGGHAIWLRPSRSASARARTRGDVAANLSRWVDAILRRTFSHHLVEESRRGGHDPGDQRAHRPAAPVPGDGRFPDDAELRPLVGSALATWATTTTWPTRRLLGAAVLGLELRLATPESNRPALRVRKRARSGRPQWGEALLERGSGPGRARGALRLHGRVDQHGNRRPSSRCAAPVPALPGEREDDGPRARGLGLHCLPDHRGEEITDDVSTAPAARLRPGREPVHAQKAILERCSEVAPLACGSLRASAPE